MTTIASVTAKCNVFIFCPHVKCEFFPFGVSPMYLGTPMCSTFTLLFGGLNAWINCWHKELFSKVSCFSFLYLPLCTFLLFRKDSVSSFPLSLSSHSCSQFCFSDTLSFLAAPGISMLSCRILEAHRTWAGVAMPHLSTSGISYLILLPTFFHRP